MPPLRAPTGIYGRVGTNWFPFYFELLSVQESDLPRTWSARSTGSAARKPPGAPDAAGITLFCDDLHVAQHAIEATVKPDHINVASLGNVVPHLHWHIVPRYRVPSCAWGAPIWPTDLVTMPNVRLPESEFEILLKQLRNVLAA